MPTQFNHPDMYRQMCEMREATRKRNEQLDQAFEDVRDRRALVFDDIATILAYSRCSNPSDSSFITGYKRSMLENDPAFRATIEHLAHLVDEYCATAERKIARGIRGVRETAIGIGELVRQPVIPYEGPLKSRTSAVMPLPGTPYVGHVDHDHHDIASWEGEGGACH